MRTLEARFSDPALDAKVACVLVERALSNGLHGTTKELARCGGAPLGNDKRIALEGIEVRRTEGNHEYATTLTACLARGKRWVVISFLERGEPCSDVEPTPEIARTLDETEFRSRMLRIEQQTAAEAIVSSLARLKDVIRTSTRESRSCPHSVPSYRSLASIDIDWLTPASRGQSQSHWAFLTTEYIKQALVDTAQPTIRANAWRTIMTDSRGYVAFYVAQNRRPPYCAPSMNQFYSGEFRGWLVIATAKGAKIVCEHEFVFESSERAVGHGCDRSIVDDFEERFRRAADFEVTRMRALE